MAAPKTTAIQVRLTKEDRERIERVARAHYLDVSAWVRMVVLRTVDTWEAEHDQGRV